MEHMAEEWQGDDEGNGRWVPLTKLWRRTKSQADNDRIHTKGRTRIVSRIARKTEKELNCEKGAGCNRYFTGYCATCSRNADVLSDRDWYMSAVNVHYSYDARKGV